MAYDPTKETRELWQFIQSNELNLNSRRIKWSWYNSYIVSLMPIKTYSEEDMELDEMYIGTIRKFAPLQGMDVAMLLQHGFPKIYNFVPCDGRELSISDNIALHTVIGHTFSTVENGKYFNLPDLRSMNPVPMIATNGSIPHRP